MSPQRSAAAARARSAAAAPAPLRRPPAPRRISGPARPPRALPRSGASSGFAVRLLDAPFLDRLIRGRVWIGIVAFSLLGIVAMQVSILRLGANIGASVEQIQRLTQTNEAAATAIAEDEPGRDVAAEASKLGMVYPPPNDVVYLRSSPGVAAVAAHSYTLPTAPILTPPSPSLTAPIAPGITTVSSTSTSASVTSSTTTSSTTTAGAGAPSADGTTAAPATTTTTTPTTGGAPQATSLNAAGAAAAPGTGATG
jgi:hypothetical protein